MNSQVAIAAARDGFGYHRLYLLRDHANVSFLAAEIAEAIVAKSVLEITEQGYVLLQRKVGAAAAATAASATTAANATATAGAAADTRARDSRAGETLSAAGRLNISRSP